MTERPILDSYAYCRVSGLTQADSERDGFPRQAGAIRTFAAREGYLIVRAFFETHTGTELERPEFLEMRDLMVSNGVKVVIIERLDRLARDLMLQETIIADFQKNGITLLSTMEPDLCSTDPSRKLFRQLMGAIAEYDRAMIVAKMSAGKARARARGVKCGGRSRYGEHKKNPQEVAILNRVFHLRRQGFNATRIAEVLNDEGLRSRKGTAFFPNQISRIMKRTPQITQEKQS